MPRETRRRVAKKKERRISNEDLLDEMILVESVLGEMLSRHAKTKRDLHETRVLLYIVLAIVMSLFGLVVGFLIKIFFM